MTVKTQKKDGITWMAQAHGPTLGFVDCALLEDNGLYFKDLARCGEVLPYEDWRLAAKERARDLAKRLSVEEIAGLMLYSPHQLVPFSDQHLPFPGHYNGKTFQESGKAPWTLTDEQQEMLQNRHIRHFLQMRVIDAATSAKWSNGLQQAAEGLPWGIPVNISTDPRHGASSSSAEFKHSGGDVSKWPEGVGMAAAFSPELVEQFAKIASTEYRALGITTALGPQIDLATDPRWMRFEDTFGGDLSLTTQYTKAYCDGMQTTAGTEDSVDPGWGSNSVSTMVKHWPGGGTGEGGRDAHYAFGAYAVYPGEKFCEHMKPFTQGAFNLNGPTQKAAAVMPYYTVSWGADARYGKNVGNSYSTYMIHDLLREQYGYDGIVCTDWGITADPAREMDAFGSRCYGVESLSEAERHLLCIQNGVDQFGGNDSIEPVLAAYRLGCERVGEPAMRARMERSAVRLLTGMFRMGLFENPYLDAEQSAAIVGCQEFVEAGLEAQRRSIVILKNKNNVLPLTKGIKLYVPKRQIEARKGFFRQMEPAHTVIPIAPCNAEGYFTLVDTPDKADAALVWMESPLSDNGYNEQDVKAGGNGYLPISLQYRPYCAKHARAHSIAGGDFREESIDRSYQNKTATAANESDLDSLLAMRKAMGNKPVIACIEMHNPAVPAEFEQAADAIAVQFGVQQQALFDVLFGAAPAQGQLPFVLPKNMETVERHCEDVSDDMEPYQDETGNIYSFGFGLEL